MRPDPADRQLGAARSVPAGPGVASMPGLSCGDHRRQRLGDASSATRTFSKACSRSSTRPAWIRPCSKLELTESVLMKHAEVAGSRSSGAARERGAARGRRLRHRLFQPELPAKVSDRHPQDRPVVRPPDHRRAEETTIVTAVISMARSLKLRVVAEGVETRRSWHSCGPTTATRRRATISAGRFPPKRSRPCLKAACRRRSPGISSASSRTKASRPRKTGDQGEGKEAGPECLVPARRSTACPQNITMIVFLPPPILWSSVDRRRCVCGEAGACVLIYTFFGNTSREVQPSLQVVVVSPAAKQ